MTTHVMLDIETLGTRVGSVVTSVAFVRFADEAHCTLNLDIAEQTARGLTQDADTLAWWQNQSPDAWRLATQNPVGVVQALQYFGQWLAWAGPDPLVWCHGATFDAPLLGELYRLFGVSCPWAYWAVRDTRTLYDLAGVDVKAFAVPPPYVALNDAIGQTRAANESLRIIARNRGLVAA